MRGLAQAGPELLGLTDPLALACLETGTTGISQHIGLNLFLT